MSRGTTKLHQAIVHTTWTNRSDLKANLAGHRQIEAVLLAGHFEHIVSIIQVAIETTLSCYGVPRVQVWWRLR